MTDPAATAFYQYPMTEMALEIEEKGEDDAPPVAPTPPPRRGPGHRGQDMRDTVAEMAAKAHEISLEAGSKMAAAMKDVIGAAAGYTAFAIESARDLVQFMVRRGQMTQDEADKLIREAEAAHVKNPKTLIPKPELKSEHKKAPAPMIVADVVLPPAASPPLHVAPKPTVKVAPAAPAKVAPATKGAAAAKPAAKAAPAKSAPVKAAPAKPTAAKTAEKTKAVAKPVAKASTAKKAPIKKK